MEWMSPIDSSFLHVENDITPMHIGGVSIFEGPPPPFEELERDGRAASSTSSRATARRSASCRSALGPPVWVDDPHFSLDYHLRHTAIPAPGSEDAAAPDGRARVLPAPRPQQAAVGDVDGRGPRATGRWALLSKVHHCMVDGVAATDLMSVMFSDTTAPRRRARVVAAARALRRSRCSCARSRTRAEPRRAAARRCGARCARRAKRCARSAEVGARDGRRDAAACARSAPPR